MSIGNVLALPPVFSIQCKQWGPNGRRCPPGTTRQTPSQRWRDLDRTRRGDSVNRTHSRRAAWRPRQSLAKWSFHPPPPERRTASPSAGTPHHMGAASTSSRDENRDRESFFGCPPNLSSRSARRCRGEAARPEAAARRGVLLVSQPVGRRWPPSIRPRVSKLPAPLRRDPLEPAAHCYAGNRPTV